MLLPMSHVGTIGYQFLTSVLKRFKKKVFLHFRLILALASSHLIWISCITVGMYGFQNDTIHSWLKEKMDILALVWRSKSWFSSFSVFFFVVVFKMIFEDLSTSRTLNKTKPMKMPDTITIILQRSLNIFHQNVSNSLN